LDAYAYAVLCRQLHHFQAVRSGHGVKDEGQRCRRQWSCFHADQGICAFTLDVSLTIGCGYAGDELHGMYANVAAKQSARVYTPSSYHELCLSNPRHGSDISFTSIRLKPAQYSHHISPMSCSTACSCPNHPQPVPESGSVVQAYQAISGSLHTRLAVKLCPLLTSCSIRSQLTPFLQAA